MFLIGERINGMFTSVAEAIKNKDEKFIQDLAVKQTECGAHCLDIALGPAIKKDADKIMAWMVEKVCEVTSVPLSIDNPHAGIIEAGLSVCKNPAIINSASLEEERFNGLTELALKYSASLIVLAMNEEGVPQAVEDKSAMGLEIIARCAEKGLDTDKIYIDPILLPVSAAQDQIKVTLDTLKELQLISDPAPKTIVGLSNISQQAKNRKIINRTFLTMAMYAGLSAAIVDPLDTDLMKTVKTAELLLNNEVYYQDFLSGFKEKV
ncbi:MAG: dihydropteroate synthase [Armatimonadota bacterium]